MLFNSYGIEENEVAFLHSILLFVIFFMFVQILTINSQKVTLIHNIKNTPYDYICIEKYFHTTTFLSFLLIYFKRNQLSMFNLQIHIQQLFRNQGSI